LLGTSLMGGRATPRVMAWSPAGADNVVSQAAIDEGRTLQGLGIEPEPIEAIVPSYLWRFRKTGQYHTLPEA
ncbi:MAG: hypothetical protein P8Y71_04170, partial [Pseudolabrys sp.]